MSPFQVVMLISATSLVLVTVLLSVIRTMPSRRGIGMWMWGAMLQAYAYLFALVLYEAERTLVGDSLFIIFQTSVNYLLVFGTILFLKHNINQKLWSGCVVLTVCFSLTLLVFESRFFGQMVFSIMSSSLFLVATYAIYKSGERRKSTRMMAFFTTLTAIHFIDYPFIMDHQLWGAVGFITGLLLGVGMFMSLSVIALEQFLERTVRSERQAIHKATHDPLTGLYNRSHLNTLFNQYVEESKNTNLSFVVLYLDLDGFKPINDNYGHKAGDMILITVAKRLKKWLGDRGDSVRIGGDEIVVFSRMRGEYNVQNAFTQARLILDSIEMPIVHGKQVFEISSSIGGCSYQPGINARSLDEMINCADDRMYKAKQAGGRCIILSDNAAAGRQDGHHPSVRTQSNTMAQCTGKQPKKLELI